MSDQTPPTPSAKAPPGPAQALKGLAARLEQGPAPDLDDVSAALDQIRASKLLDKASKGLVVEAREDVKAGRMPDSLSLRMIAKAVTVAIEAGAEVIVTPGTTATPVGGGDLGRTKTVEPAPAVSKIEAAAFVDAARPETDQERSWRLRQDVLDLNRTPIDTDKLVSNLRAQTDRVVDSLTEGEREVLETRIGKGKPGPGRPKGSKNGKVKAPPLVFASHAMIERERQVEDDEAEADHALVARAAELLEKNGDMPEVAEVIGALYELAEKLELHPIQVDGAEPLLARAERALAREVERALVQRQGSHLPSWVFEWIKTERERR